MGLKSKLSKMKSFLFDEEEIEEKPVKKNVKKIIKEEVTQKKEEVSEDFAKTNEIDSLYLEDLSEPEPEIKPEIKSRVVKNEAEFKFPEFDDDDFMVSRSKPEPIIKPVKEEPKPVLYQGSKRKEETKKFKPSPIISPVYGLLDSEGNKVQKKAEKKETPLKSKEELTFDEIRKKAYGNLDEEIENTLKRLSKKTIAEAEEEMEQDEAQELSRTKQKAKKLEKEDVTLIKTDEEDDDDDMILPNVNFKEIDVDKERQKMPSKKGVTNKKLDDDDDDDDTKEQDLFNLIDTMYQGEEKED